MSAWNSSVRVQYRPILAEKGQAQSAGKFHSDPDRIDDRPNPGSGGLSGLINRKTKPSRPSIPREADDIAAFEGATPVSSMVEGDDRPHVSRPRDIAQALPQEQAPRRAFTVRLPKSLAGHLAKRAFADNATYQDIIQTAVQKHLTTIEDDIKHRQGTSPTTQSAPLLTPHRRRIQKLFL